MQDRDGAKPALLQAYLCTQARFVFTGGAFVGRLLDWAYTILRTTLHIVRKPADQTRLRRHPAPVGRRAHLRLARDHERDPAISEAMIRWAAIFSNTLSVRNARTTCGRGSRTD